MFVPPATNESTHFPPSIGASFNAPMLSLFINDDIASALLSFFAKIYLILPFKNDKMLSHHALKEPWLRSARKLRYSPFSLLQVQELAETHLNLQNVPEPLNLYCYLWNNVCCLVIVTELTERHKNRIWQREHIRTEFWKSSYARQPMWLDLHHH